MKSIYMPAISTILVVLLGLTACVPGGGGMMGRQGGMMGPNRMGDTLPIGVKPSQLPDPESNGAKLLSQYCSQCHKIPSPRLHTDDEWPLVLTRMVERMDMMDIGGMGMMQVESPSQAELVAISSYLGVNSMAGLDPQQMLEMTGPGAEAFREVCSVCHALPDPRQHTRDTWPAVVDRMAQNMRSLNGVVPSDSELEQIIRFLQSNASSDE